MAESEQESVPLRVASFMAFATLGVLSTTQELAGTVLGSVDGADPELIAEETLCLVATATARAAEVGLRETPAVAAAVVPALAALPFIYRDYLVGGALMATQEQALLDESEAIYLRLRRKLDFYTVHLPPGPFPGERALTDKMGLWMGRISPPRLPEMPTERLARLPLIPALLTHLRLVLAYGRRPSDVF